MRRCAVVPPALVLAVALLGACAGGDDGVDDGVDKDAGRASSTTEVRASVTTSVTVATGPVVAVFGDSLAFQAWSEIEAATARRGYVLAGDAVPGDALCDAPDHVETVMARRPAYVVLAYVGNNNTPCTGRATGVALADIYEVAAERIVEIADGMSEVVIVGPPAMAGQHFVETSELVRERYEHVAGRYDHVAFVDGREVLSPDGYAERLPCLPSEDAELGCDGGTIVVRFYDGVHLDWPDDGYSAGGRRWAEAIVSSLPEV